MRSFLEFCITIFSSMITMIFSLNIGGYTFGSFLTAVLVITVLVGSLVVVFRRRNNE